MVTINLRLIGDIILLLVGIIAIIFLALFLKKASGLVESIQKIVDKNESNLDDVDCFVPCCQRIFLYS